MATVQEEIKSFQHGAIQPLLQHIKQSLVQFRAFGLHIVDHPVSGLATIFNEAHEAILKAEQKITDDTLAKQQAIAKAQQDAVDALKAKVPEEVIPFPVPDHVEVKAAVATESVAPEAPEPEAQ